MTAEVANNEGLYEEGGLVERVLSNVRGDGVYLDAEGSGLPDLIVPALNSLNYSLHLAAGPSGVNEELHCRVCDEAKQIIEEMVGRILY
jgi:hypothetical protein